VDVSGDLLTVRVRGKRAGALPDGQQVLDRVRAVGGELTERPTPDGGAEVCVGIPLRPVPPGHTRTPRCSAEPLTRLL
jgi:hypothetical protein